MVTDSEPVPRGKGEKHPVKGSETVPEIVRPHNYRGGPRGRCGLPFA